ncbi:MAG: response regulator [Bacteroidota bacterium]
MKKLKTILLVDDDIDDRSVFSEIINEINPTLRCITAFDGIDALNILNENGCSPDLIFLDINMPRLSGKQCLYRIKHTPGISSIPVVMFSTTKREKDMVESIEMGAVAFMSKPYHWQDLKAAITDVLETQLFKTISGRNQVDKTEISSC